MTGFACAGCLRLPVVCQRDRLDLRSGVFVNVLLALTSSPLCSIARSLRVPLWCARVCLCGVCVCVCVCVRIRRSPSHCSRTLVIGLRETAVGRSRSRLFPRALCVHLRSLGHSPAGAVGAPGSFPWPLCPRAIRCPYRLAYPCSVARLTVTLRILTIQIITTNLTGPDLNLLTP